MKFAAKMALGTALALGLASPVLAKEKAPSAASYSANFRAAAGPVQTALQAKNFAEAKAKLPALEAVAQSPAEKFMAAQFGYQIATNANDAAATRTALEAMLASGGAPADKAGVLYLAAGQSAYVARDYARAAQLLKMADDVNAAGPDGAIMLADAYFRTNQIALGSAMLDKAIAAKKASGQPVPQEWYKIAISNANRAKDAAAVAKWSRDLVIAYPTPEYWRAAIALYRDANGLDPQAAMDSYRLMRAAGAMAGERDYFEYADFAAQRGLVGEAKAVIDEAYARNQVPTGSRALPELRTLVNGKLAADRASLAASERSAATQATGRGALATGDAFMGYGDTAKAIALYRLAIQKGGIDLPTANLRLGAALAKSGDVAGARTAFQAVTGVRQPLAQYWLTWLDQKK